jgi:hypothetical protein
VYSGTMTTSGLFLSAVEVAYIPASIAVAATLTSLLFEAGGLPERLANVLFFICLLSIWLAVCGVVLVRAAIWREVTRRPTIFRGPPVAHRFRG